MLVIPSDSVTKVANIVHSTSNLLTYFWTHFKSSNKLDFISFCYIYFFCYNDKSGFRQFRVLTNPTVARMSINANALWEIMRMTQLSVLFILFCFFTVLIVLNSYGKVRNKSLSSKIFDWFKYVIMNVQFIKSEADFNYVNWM